MAARINRPSLIVSTPRTRRAYDAGVKAAATHGDAGRNDAFEKWESRVFCHEDYTYDEDDAWNAGFDDTYTPAPVSPTVATLRRIMDSAPAPEAAAVVVGSRVAYDNGDGSESHGLVLRIANGGASVRWDGMWRVTGMWALTDLTVLPAAPEVDRPWKLGANATRYPR